MPKVETEVKKDVKKDDTGVVGADAPAAAPKRRGRPPKAAAEKTAAAAPKRRGRPPKAAVEKTAAAPKRRGRPPKATTTTTAAKTTSTRKTTSVGEVRREMKVVIDGLKAELKVTKAGLAAVEKREAKLVKMFDQKEKAVAAFASKWQRQALRGLSKPATRKSTKKSK